MNKGFILLEVLLALLMTSFLSVAVLTVVNQIVRTQQFVERVADITQKALFIQNEWEREISSALVTEEKKQKTPTKDEKEPKPIDHVFFVETAENGIIKTFSFFTHSPLISYWDKKIGKLKSRIARVVYTLEADSQRKDSYTLFRQEGANLLWEPYKGEKDFPRTTMATGIKELKLVLYAKPQEQKKEQAAEQKIQIKKTTTWNYPSQEHTKKQLPRLPQVVEVSLQLWEQDQKNWRSFMFSCSPMVDVKATSTTEKSDNTIAQPETIDKATADKMIADKAIASKVTSQAQAIKL